MTSLRITFVAAEVRGSHPAGGLGTATTYLALALARLGHQVDVLHFGIHATGEVEPAWACAYETAGVRVRFLPRGDPAAVEPSYLFRTTEVERALRAAPPDVVIAQDMGGPVYAALRARALGHLRDLDHTLFVVFCHGSTGWIKHANRNPRFLPLSLGRTLIEQASLELADVVVSPSAYLADWMRRRGWELPARTYVIPYVTRAGALGQPRPTTQLPTSSEPVERLAFFGRLEERKGIRPFVGALNALEPELLGRVEVEFVGGELPMKIDEVRELFSEHAAGTLRGLRFETRLEQQEAIDHLRRPGTLVAMPSLEDNSPNTVYECLEHGIPFLAGSVGGAGELVAPEDRGRVLCEPSVEGLLGALRRVLVEGVRPARAAFDQAESLRRWREVLALAPRVVSVSGERPLVEVVVVFRGSESGLQACLAGLAAQEDAESRVTVVVAGPGLAEPADLPARVRVVRSERSSHEGAREAALAGLEGEWVVFLGEEDVPEAGLLSTLVRAQQASGADVVSCGLFLTAPDGARTVRLFPGEPHALGLLENGYGTVALVRRALLGEWRPSWPVEDDPDWVLLARLSAAGAKIVSVPVPLVSRRSAPGSLERSPSDALLVVEELERALPGQLASSARLAAGLAADARDRPWSVRRRRTSSRLRRLVRAPR